MKQITFQKQTPWVQPKKVLFCKKCVISNQRPRINIDENGICSACNFAYKKHHIIDWEERKRQLLELLNRFRSEDGSYDIVVPSSGGKDSGRVAHELKHKYGMHPLTVTWAPHVYTDIGWKNFQAFIDSGFDNILGTPNGLLHRELTRYAFEKIGDPFQPFIYGQKAFPLQMAVKYKIPLIMYGENGEVEYGGDEKNEDRPSHNLTGDLLNHYFSGVTPEELCDYKYSKTDLQAYYPPEQELMEEIGVECHFYGYYKKWIPQENFYYSVEHTGFEVNSDGRSESTYSKYASLDDRLDGFHFYLAYIKFGIGRATSDAAHEIRDGHITREEGVALVRRFAGEFPEKYFKEFLEYIDISEEKFWEIIDSFRPPHLWKKINGEWKIKYQVK